MPPPGGPSPSTTKDTEIVVRSLYCSIKSFFNEISMFAKSELQTRLRRRINAAANRLEKIIVRLY